MDPSQHPAMILGKNQMSARVCQAELSIGLFSGSYPKFLFWCSFGVQGSTPGTGSHGLEIQSKWQIHEKQWWVITRGWGSP